MEFRVTGLDGKVVVITGGARGMGAAYVRGFLAEGAKVVAADLSWDGVEVFRDEAKTAGGLPLMMDVTDNRAIDAAYAAVIERFGTVDVLVNNAGMRQRDLYPPHGRVTTLETSDADCAASTSAFVIRDRCQLVPPSRVVSSQPRASQSQPCRPGRKSIPVT